MQRERKAKLLFFFLILAEENVYDINRSQILNFLMRRHGEKKNELRQKRQNNKEMFQKHGKNSENTAGKNLLHCFYERFCLFGEILI